MQSPTPANPDNVQRQLAIFDVVRRAPGKSLLEVKSMLTKAFAERGLSRQPGTWLDAVASAATYGKPYIVDLPAAVAADSITTAPDPDVEAALRKRRILRRSEGSTGSQSRSPAATTPTGERKEAGHVTDSGEEDRHDRDAAHTFWASRSSTRTVLGLLATALAISLVAAAVRMAVQHRR